MSDYSLVPVDHQPDFGDVSLIPVDHDPFSADGAIQQAATQPEGQPSPLATATDLPDVGAPAMNAPAMAFDKPTVDWSRYNQAFGELKAATYTPTQHIGNLVADGLTGLGMQPYTANDLTSRLGNVLGLSPLGVAGAGLDLIDAQRRGDIRGALVAAAGVMPGAKLVARGVARSVAREAAGEALQRAAESGFSQAELGVIREAQSIATSPRMVDLAAAHGAGEPMMVNTGGRLIQYEPSLPGSGISMFGENGFVVGPQAFSSSLEHNQTVLHELHRLNFRDSAGGVSADLATRETKAAEDFAARAAKYLP